ncbi:protein kinase [Tahibacter sp. UC22_41]|uniref:protein kinase domain-containing protein n=1 Tax=Tahibacter sp. UC22_41 TaxID=3350178 RepID=UPI0036D936D7
MTPERWQQLQAVLAMALEHPADQQPAALVAACGDDTDLLDEARALLAHGDVLPERLPPAAFAALAAEADEDDWRGRRVGLFLLDARIGSGGSSSVYRARRVNDFEQVVALKLLRHHDRASLRRFERERTILAQLSHPHIAKLFDAGIADDGTPYLVLEYIEGRTWQRWLAETAPDLRRRIRQFLLVCDAVEHAHRHLLVHRDLKPANILVDTDDMPRLLDFGVAALLQQHDSTLTREGAAAMTPAYAAPEQLRGDAVTTATDVYALGLVLYETLSGRHPFRKSGDSERELLQAIATRDATRPSQQVDATSPLRAADLRGDLDNIVLAAIEREPSRRYRSVRELADDLRAWLDGRPVSARPQTWTYLTRKFVARHRAAVATAAIATLALVGTSAVALWQAHVAVQQRERAQQRFAEVRRFANNLLFDYHEGIQKLAGSLPMQQRLVRDGIGYLERLSTEAGDDADLWREIAAGYLKVGDLQGNPYGANLGDFAGAARSYAHADTALAQAEARGETAATRLWRARLLLRHAYLHYQNTELDPARERTREALGLFDALHAAAPGDLDTTMEYSDALDLYGELLGLRGDDGKPDADGARRHQLQAAELRRAELAKTPDDKRVRYAVYNSLLREGIYRVERNEMTQAETALLDALRLIRELVATDPNDTYRQREVGVVLARLVQVQDALGKLDASVDSALQGVALMEGMLARDPDNDSIREGVTSTTGWAARQLVRAGRAGEALPMVRRQIAVNEARLRAAPDNPAIRYDLSLAYRRLGEQRAAVQDYAGAIEAHRKALAMQRELAALSADYAAGVALSQWHVGRAELGAGRVAAARTTLAEAADALGALVTAQALGPSYGEDLADAYVSLARAWAAAPPVRERAADAYGRAVAIWDGFERDGTLSPKSLAKRDEARAELRRLR